MPPWYHAARCHAVWGAVRRHGAAVGGPWQHRGMVSLGYVVLYARDLDASRTFYSALGPATRTRLGVRLPGAEAGTVVDPDGNVVEVESA